MNSESNDLTTLRDLTSKILLAMVWLHVPIAAAIGFMRGTDWMMPTVFGDCDGLRRQRILANFPQRPFYPPDLRRRL